MFSKRLSLVGVYLAAALAAGGLLAPGFAQPGPAGAPAPRVVFDATTYDFGKVMEGESARHDFAFHNPGDATLEIRDIRVTCGCTKAADWDRTVAPGGTGKIPLALSTAGYRGDVKKSVHVTTNVPGQEKITLWLKGSIWQQIEVQPRYASFGQIQDRNASQSTTLKIASQLEESLEITNVESDNKTFQAELKPITPGKEYELKVTAVPPFRVGSNRGTITLHTSHAKKPKIPITANCYVPVPVQVAPARLVLLAAPLTKAMERAVYVTHNVGGPLKISDVHLNAEGVEVRVVEDIAGKRYRIVMEFPAGFTMPEEEELKLTFKTDDPSAPMVEVPFIKAAPAVRPQPPKPGGGNDTR